MDRPINADLLAAARAFPLPASPLHSPTTRPENVASFSRLHIILSHFGPMNHLLGYTQQKRNFVLTTSQIVSANTTTPCPACLTMSSYSSSTSWMT